MTRLEQMKARFDSPQEQASTARGWWYVDTRADEMIAELDQADREIEAIAQILIAAVDEGALR